MRSTTRSISGIVSGSRVQGYLSGPCERKPDLAGGRGSDQRPVLPPGAGLVLRLAGLRLEPLDDGWWRPGGEAVALGRQVGDGYQVDLALEGLPGHEEGPVVGGEADVLRAGQQRIDAVRPDRVADRRSARAGRHGQRGDEGVSPVALMFSLEPFLLGAVLGGGEDRRGAVDGGGHRMAVWRGVRGYLAVGVDGVRLGRDRAYGVGVLLFHQLEQGAEGVGPVGGDDQRVVVRYERDRAAANVGRQPGEPSVEQ